MTRIARRRFSVVFDVAVRGSAPERGICNRHVPRNYLAGLPRTHQQLEHGKDILLGWHGVRTREPHKSARDVVDMNQKESPSSVSHGKLTVPPRRLEQHVHKEHRKTKHHVRHASTSTFWNSRENSSPPNKHHVPSFGRHQQARVAVPASPLVNTFFGIDETDDQSESNREGGREGASPAPLSHARRAGGRAGRYITPLSAQGPRSTRPPPADTWQLGTAVRGRTHRVCEGCGRR